MLQKPQQWIASLYFLEAVPYFFITIVVSLIYQNYGMTNGATVFLVSLLSIPWAIKPLFSPFLEQLSNKKKLIVLSQCGFVLIYFSLFTITNSALFIKLSFVCFLIITMLSSLHDTLCDGLYLHHLSHKQQQRFVGLRTICYQLGLLFIKGGVLVMIGKVSLILGLNQWQLMFLLLSLTCLLFASYHKKTLPETTLDSDVTTFPTAQVLKKVILPTMIPGLLLSFLYNLPDAQLQKIIPLFLSDHSGLDLGLNEVGKIYGFLGGLAFIAGVYISSKLMALYSLNKYLLIMLVSLLIRPIILLMLNPEALSLSYIIIPISQCISGMSSSAYMGYLMTIANKSPHPMSAYTICISLMTLSYIVFGMLGGLVEQCLGYSHFFYYLFVSNLLVVLIAIKALKNE